MRRAALFVVVFIAIGFTTTIAAAQRAAGDVQSADAAKLNEPAASRTDASQPSDSWRYRRHDGLWWYWLPSEKWVYWTGDRWTAYQPQKYTEFRATRPQQRSSYYQAEQGNWGPVRYDRFGQVQYPYSQRKTGIRQLGPVPALGGVRAMPGWGGER